MKKIITFITKVNDDNIMSISYELTYKLLLSLFPFIIFLMSVLGHLELDSSIIIEGIAINMPDEVLNIIKIFMHDVIDVKNTKILSSSLFLSIWSSSSGFSSVIKGINKTYEETDRRNFIQIRLLSIILVLLFVVCIVFSILLLIFGNSIQNYLLSLDISADILQNLFGFSSYFFTVGFLFLTVILIYKFSLYKKVSLFSVAPGAITTVVFWIISSKLFNIYIDNFSKYSTVYGSIGSIFILMLWLNLMCFFLLIGSEINALISEKE